MISCLVLCNLSKQTAATAHELHPQASYYTRVPTDFPSSNVVPRLTVSMTVCATLIMIRATNRFIAYVAEHFLTIWFSANKQIALASLWIDWIAFWTFGTKLNVNVGILLEAQMLLNQFKSYCWWQNCFFFFETFWILFIVHLSFGRFATRPTHPTKALSTLYMSTTAFIFWNWDATSLIRAGFGTVFEENHIQFSFQISICLHNFFDLFFTILIEINPVKQASFERMSTTLTTQAKEKFTMLASSLILTSFNICNASTSNNRAPAQVLHLCDSIMQTEFLIFLNHLFRQTHTFHI